MGRPPVCYQFLCETILEAQSTPQSRYALAILASLVAHAGKKVRGRQHIVELTDTGQLKQINLTRFERQLNEAQNAFMLVRAYLDGQIAELIPSPALMKISMAPAGLFPKRFRPEPGGYRLNTLSRRRQKGSFGPI